MSSKAIKFNVMWWIGKVGNCLEGTVWASKNFHYLWPTGGDKKNTPQLASY